MRIRYAVILAAAAILPAVAQRQSTKPAAAKPNPAADWPMYNRDLGGTRYSPLTQISTTNVANLKMAWSYRLSNAPAGRGAAPAPAPEAAAGQGGRGGGGERGAAPVPTVNPEATPIVVNGVMYLPAGGRVLGLEADTGKLVWGIQAAHRQHLRARGYVLAGRGHDSASNHLHRGKALDGSERAHR